MQNNNNQSLNNIDFIQSLFDISWVLMDFARDKRYPIGEGPVKPRKGIPQEVLQAIVNLNAMTSQVLALYNKPPEEYDHEIPTDTIDTIDLSKE